MSKRKISSAVAVIALFAAAGASAGDRYYPGHHRADPQVRLGIDVVWGGHGYAPRPVVAYPVRYVPVAYAPVHYAPRHHHAKHHRKHASKHFQSRQHSHRGRGHDHHEHDRHHHHD